MIDQDKIFIGYGGREKFSLNNILETENDDNSVYEDLEIKCKSLYYDDTHMLDFLCKKSNCLNILSLNCQSINAKIDQLKIKIAYYRIMVLFLT